MNWSGGEWVVPNIAQSPIFPILHPPLIPLLFQFINDLRTLRQLYFHLNFISNSMRQFILINLTFCFHSFNFCFYKIYFFLIKNNRILTGILSIYFLLVIFFIVTFNLEKQIFVKMFYLNFLS